MTTATSADLPPEATTTLRQLQAAGLHEGETLAGWYSEPADTRTVPCDYCDGGWTESYPTQTPNGPHYSYSQCTACGGTGEVTIELQMIEQEDLEDA